jgi:hypothetical protein
MSLTTVSLEHFECASCAIYFAIPEKLAAICRSNSSEKFFCPHGHVNVFRDGTEDKMRRERDRAVQDKARLEDELRVANEAATSERKPNASRNTQVRGCDRDGVAIFRWQRSWSCCL